MKNFYVAVKSKQFGVFLVCGGLFLGIHATQDQDGDFRQGKIQLVQQGDKSGFLKINRNELISSLQMNPIASLSYMEIFPGFLGIKKHVTQEQWLSFLEENSSEIVDPDLVSVHKNVLIAVRAGKMALEDHSLVAGINHRDEYEAMLERKIEELEAQELKEEIQETQLLLSELDAYMQDIKRYCASLETLEAPASSQQLSMPGRALDDEGKELWEVSGESKSLASAVYVKQQRHHSRDRLVYDAKKSFRGK